MMYQDMYNCICQNTKNEDILSSMSNLQPNWCLKIDFQKVDQHAGGKWLIHDTKRRKDNQLQSLKLPYHRNCPASKMWKWWYDVQQQLFVQFIAKHGDRPHYTISTPTMHCSVNKASWRLSWTWTFCIIECTNFLTNNNFWHCYSMIYISVNVPHKWALVHYFAITY